MHHEPGAHNLRGVIQDPFDGLHAFLAVARRHSFTAAAAELGVTPTATSKQIKVLEARLGVLLFQRTTRRVALTEAGQALLERITPAALAISTTLEDLGVHAQRPRGTLRITAPTIAGPVVLDEVLPRMRAAHPQVALEVSLDDATVDLVRAGYDAGMRTAEAVEKDMVAVQITAETRWAIVGSPGYFASVGKPRVPADLARHRAIRQRMRAGGNIYRWEVLRGSREVTMDVPGDLVLDNLALMAAMARAGLGLAYLPEVAVLADVAAGRLQRVLDSHLRPGPGLWLYFPAGAQTQPKLRAFLDVLQAWAKERKRRRA